MAKNLMGKARKQGNPYLSFTDGSWTWHVLKSWQGDNAKAYARWYCDVEGFYRETGDVYVYDIVSQARLVYADPTVFPDGFVIPKAVKGAML